MKVGMVNDTAFRGRLKINNDLVTSNDDSRPCDDYMSYYTDKIRYIEENANEQGCKIYAYHANGKFYSDKIDLPIEKVLTAYTAAKGEDNSVIVKLAHA